MNAGFAVFVSSRKSQSFLNWEIISGNGTASHAGRPGSTDRIFAVMRRLESKNVF